MKSASETAALLLLAALSSNGPAPDVAAQGEPVAEPLPLSDRRGATWAERLAVSKPEHADRALAGVWEWHSMRIVVAEDAWNCLPTGHCNFVLLDRAGMVVIAGVALERPAVQAKTGLTWIGPDGRGMKASALP